MNEKEEVDKWCKDYYGFTVDEADEDIGYWMDKHYQLQQETQLLKDRIEKVDKFCKEQKQKMYKNRNKIAVFILSKIQDLLKGDKNE